jgi:hypothetical protein
VIGRTLNAALALAAMMGVGGVGPKAQPRTRALPAPALPPRKGRTKRMVRRQSDGAVMTEHASVIATLRSRPINVPRGPTRNALKRYRQGRATWSDVQRAARQAVS